MKRNETEWGLRILGRNKQRARKNCQFRGGARSPGWMSGRDTDSVGSWIDLIIDLVSNIVIDIVINIVTVTVHPTRGTVGSVVFSWLGGIIIDISKDGTGKQHIRRTKLAMYALAFRDSRGMNRPEPANPNCTARLVWTGARTTAHGTP
eukprot:jgi/Psemu1/7180/gm1.7180_g